MIVKSAVAPPGPGRLELGRTLPSLFAEAVEKRPNDRAFNGRVSMVPGRPGGPGLPWRSYSNADFVRRAQALAAGLRAMGLERGDRVALFVHSDLSFALTDMACLIGGLVDVPVYLTHTHEAMRYIVEQSGAAAVLASDEALLGEMLRVTAGLDRIKFLAVAHGQVPAGSGAGRLVTSLDAIEAKGEAALAREPELVARFASEIHPKDVATIIYTSGTTGAPKGVMLSHENLTSNAIGALSDLSTYREGAGETVLSFLPLTHIFGRTLLYASIYFGSSVYFGTTDSVREDLQEVKPTFMAAVPRVLEKSWERMEAVGDTLTGVKKALYARALAFAGAYDVRRPATGLAAAERGVLDRLVYSKWREALGGRLRTIIVGGAALRPELVNRLAAAHIVVLQGYGLTETSPVICYNRPERNRPGTVGQAIPGVEMAVDDEGEILTRGPHVMLGYYGHPDETAKAIDGDGWFHTGDLGALDDDGYLSITGRLKSIFKLSTGKYVMPDPIVERLEANPLIATAIVVGSGEKYCTALLFLDHDGLAARYGGADAAVLAKPGLAGELREVVRRANEGMPDWSSVKRVAALLKVLTMADGSVTPKLSIRRDKVVADNREVVRALYAEAPAPAGALFLEVEVEPAGVGRGGGRV